jgi:O-methyltransferase involved in polyketide biosynthesis
VHGSRASPAIRSKRPPSCRATSSATTSSIGSARRASTPTSPALVVWEGVVYYLTEAAVRATCTRIASGCHAGTRLVLDILGKRFAKGEMKNALDQRAHELVSEMGEPIRFGIDDPLPLLCECGFRSVDVRSFDEIALTYTGTYERDRKMRFQSVVGASVSAPPRR